MTIPPPEKKKLGISHKTQPISVKFPDHIDELLRNRDVIPDRSSYIRNAVIAFLEKDEYLGEKTDD